MKSSVLLTWEIPDTYNPAQPFTVRTAEINTSPSHMHRTLHTLWRRDFIHIHKHSWWHEPTQPMQILYDNGQSVEVDGKLTQKLITGLQPETQYSFLLTNRGNSAGGLQHRVSTMTAPDILRTKPYLMSKTNSDGMVIVELPAVQTSERVRWVCGGSNYNIWVLTSLKLPACTRLDRTVTCKHIRLLIHKLTW